MVVVHSSDPCVRLIGRVPSGSRPEGNHLVGVRRIFVKLTIIGKSGESSDVDLQCDFNAIYDCFYCYWYI